MTRLSDLQPSRWGESSNYRQALVGCIRRDGSREKREGRGEEGRGEE